MDRRLLVAIFLITIAAASAQVPLEERVLEFTEYAEDTVIVYGEKASGAERLTLMLVKDLYPDISLATVVEEKDFDPSDYPGKKIVLIGGPLQNKIAEDALSGESYIVEDYSVGKIVFIGDYMIFSDPAGFGEIYPRTSAAKSPLSKYMPLAFVPLAASLISISLMWLWNIIKKILESLGEGLLADKVMKKVKKKTVSHEFKGFHLKGIRIKYIEWLSIFIAAAVFAAAISYTYFTESAALNLILLTFSVNLIIYFIQHFTRLMMDRHHSTHTQYHLWGFGIFITLFSGWLGNTFGLAGYTSSEEGHEKHKAKILYNILAATFFFGVFFLIWNFNYPGKIAQMAMVSLITYSFLNILPFDPFKGKDILKWSKARWWLMFIPVLLVYLMVVLVY